MKTFSCLYTKQKNKKRKSYADGFFRLQEGTASRKGLLFSEDNQCIGSILLRRSQVVASGETIEMDSYLVDLDEECATPSTTSNGDAQVKDGAPQSSLQPVPTANTRRPAHGIQSKKPFKRPKFSVPRPQANLLVPIKESARATNSHWLSPDGEQPTHRRSAQNPPRGAGAQQTFGDGAGGGGFYDRMSNRQVPFRTPPPSPEPQDSISQRLGGIPPSLCVADPLDNAPSVAVSSRPSHPPPADSDAGARRFDEEDEVMSGRQQEEWSRGPPPGGRSALDLLSLFGDDDTVSTPADASNGSLNFARQSQSQAASHFSSSSSNQFSSSTSANPFASASASASASPFSSASANANPFSSVNASANDDFALDIDIDLSDSSSSAPMFLSANSHRGSQNNSKSWLLPGRNSKPAANPQHSENAPRSSLNARQRSQNPKAYQTTAGMPSKHVPFNRTSTSDARVPGTASTRVQPAFGAARVQSQSNDASSLLSLSAEDFDFDFEMPNASASASSSSNASSGTSTPTSTAPTSIVNHRSSHPGASRHQKPLSVLHPSNTRTSASNGVLPGASIPSHKSAHSQYLLPNPRKPNAPQSQNSTVNFPGSQKSQYSAPTNSNGPSPYNSTSQRKPLHGSTNPSGLPSANSTLQRRPLHGASANSHLLQSRSASTSSSLLSMKNKLNSKRGGSLLGKRLQRVTTGVFFPSPDVCARQPDKRPPPQVPLTIPDVFGSLSEYRNVYEKALQQEINHRLADVAGKFAQAFLKITSPEMLSAETKSLIESGAHRRPSCPKHGRCGEPIPVRKEGANQGRMFFACPTVKRGCFFLWEDEFVKQKTSNGSSQSNASGSSNHKPSSTHISNPVHRQQKFRSAGVPYYTSCTLLKSGGIFNNYKQKWNKKRKRKFGSYDDAEDADPYGDGPSGGGGSSSSYSKKPVKYWLKIKCAKEKNDQYAKDDLWVISFDASFSQTFVLRSLYHGPASNTGIMQMEKLSGSVVPQLKKGEVDVSAIRIGGVSSEISMMLNLAELSQKTCPLVRLLLRGDLPSGAGNGKQVRRKSGGRSGFVLPRLALARPTVVKTEEGKSSVSLADLVRQSPQITPALVARTRDDVAQRFHLNVDQQRVLDACANWFLTRGDSEGTMTAERAGDAIVLVHGVFGSGKSFLLTALVTFLCEMMDNANMDDIRILIASQTNVAVDRVLEGLKSHGFLKFARVGSLKRISKEILQHVLHYNEIAKSAEETHKAAIQEMQRMLQDPRLANSDRKAIREAQDELRKARATDRANRLQKMRVVGATCAATAFEVLKGSRFAIVILDESSQMIEPMSLLPMKFGCEKLIAVGDPKQLPPTIASCGSLQLANSAQSMLPAHLIGSAHDTSLAKTMFVRLTNCAIDPILLRTQYRCHPALTRIPNQLFYSNQLRDGVTAEQRPALVEGLPPLMLCNVANGRESTSSRFSGSLFNETEARAVCRTVLALVRRGVSPQSIGIIALYKSQISRLRTLVDQLDLDSAWGSSRGKPAYTTNDDEENKESTQNSVCEGAVQINTVDSFQGGEKSVILLSCVRTAGIGFADSPNRLNVALTRASHHLVIFAHVANMSSNSLWRQLISKASDDVVEPAKLWQTLEK